MDSLIAKATAPQASEVDPFRAELLDWQHAPYDDHSLIVLLTGAAAAENPD